ncbi:hypothetical protein [Desulfurococcus sp.]
MYSSINGPGYKALIMIVLVNDARANVQDVRMNHTSGLSIEIRDQVVEVDDNAG